LTLTRQRALQSRSGTTSHHRATSRAKPRLPKVVSIDVPQKRTWGDSAFSWPASPGGSRERRFSDDAVPQSERIGLGELCVQEQSLGLGHSLPIAVEARAGVPVHAARQRVPRQARQEAASSSSQDDAADDASPAASDAGSGEWAPRRHIFRSFGSPGGDASVSPPKQQALEVHAAELSTSSSDESDTSDLGKQQWKQSAAAAWSEQASPKSLLAPVGSASSSQSSSSSGRSSPAPDEQGPANNALVVTSSRDTLPDAARCGMLASSLPISAAARAAPSRSTSLMEAARRAADAAHRQHAVSRCQSMSAVDTACARWSLREAFEDLATRHVLLERAMAHDEEVEERAERRSSLEGSGSLDRAGSGDASFDRRALSGDGAHMPCVRLLLGSMCLPSRLCVAAGRTFAVN
jgi:hypothetical protein